MCQARLTPATQLKREVQRLTQKWDGRKKDIPRTTADLADPEKFGVADAEEFGRLVASLQKDIDELKQVRVGYAKALRELETAMLKGQCIVFVH